MNIFETYPLPWGCTTGESSLNFEDANEKQFFFAHFSSYEYTCFLRRTTDCLNALNGIENPVQWVADAKFTIEESTCIFKDAKQRIAELEATNETLISNSLSETKNFFGWKEKYMSERAKDIQVAIEYFTRKVVPLAEVQDWSNGIDPTAPEEQ